MPTTEERIIGEYLKCLLYGKWGSGKTWTLGTAPKPIYVFDCDNGLETLSGVPDITYDIYAPKENRKDMLPLNSLISKVNEFVDECPYATVALDSATVLSVLCKNRIVTLNDRWNKDAPMRIQDWMTLAKDLGEIFMGLLSIDANIIVTGHSRVSVSDETSSVLYLILSEAGQAFPQSAPIYFDEIYRQVVVSKPSMKIKAGVSASNQYLLQTEEIGNWRCKSRLNYYDYEKGKKIRVLDRFEEPDITAMVERVHEAREKQIAGRKERNAK